LLEIPGQMHRHRSPWQRSYKENQKAVWQQLGNDSYCDLVKTKINSVILMDLIDASIFDFLIQNGDRHHVSPFYS
jgi:glycosaminoglycan xylosylkinase